MCVCARTNPNQLLLYKLYFTMSISNWLVFMVSVGRSQTVKIAVSAGLLYQAFSPTLVTLARSTRAPKSTAKAHKSVILNIFSVFHSCVARDTSAV